MLYCIPEWFRLEQNSCSLAHARTHARKQFFFSLVSSFVICFLISFVFMAVIYCCILNCNRMFCSNQRQSDTLYIFHAKNMPQNKINIAKTRKGNENERKYGTIWIYCCNLQKWIFYCKWIIWKSTTFRIFLFAGRFTTLASPLVWFNIWIMSLFFFWLLPNFQYPKHYTKDWC